MSEKEEVLRQISDIKNHLIDKQSFFPYDYNACYIWSGIGLLLSLFMPYLYTYGVIVGSGAVLFLMVVGFAVEGLLTRKVNRRYDIEASTARQSFINQSFVMITLFLVVLSAVLAAYKLYTPIYLSWLALISFGYYLVGYVTNIKRFRQLGMFNIYLAVGLLILLLVSGSIEGDDTLFFRIAQASTVIGLSLIPAVITWQIKQKEQGSV